MMKAVLKTLALSFGGGLALGAGIRLTQGAPGSRREPPLDLDPLLNRLKNVETRILHMESAALAESTAGAAAAPAFAAAAEQTLTEFESRLAAQAAQVGQLRGEFQSLDHRLDHRLEELDAKIPAIVESTVDVRFQEVARELRQDLQDFEGAQARSMEAFVQTLQNKVVERMLTLETNLNDQSDVIGKLRDASLKTDENLQKMLAGIEQLVGQARTAPSSGIPSAAPPGRTGAEPERSPEPAVTDISEILPHTAPGPDLVPESPAEVEIPVEIPVLARGNGAIAPNPAPGPVPITAASPVAEPGIARVGESHTAAPAAGGPVEPPAAAEETGKEESYEWVNRIGLELLAPRPKPRPAWRMPLAVGLVAGLLLIAGAFYAGIPQRYFDMGASAPQTSALASTAPAPEPASPPAAPADLQALEQRAAAKPGDPASLVELGREYARRKDWAKAETTYRSALAANPGNSDAAFGLSDVLYQEQKYEESAAVLNKLSSSSGKAQ